MQWHERQRAQTQPKVCGISSNDPRSTRRSQGLRSCKAAARRRSGSPRRRSRRRGSRPRERRRPLPRPELAARGAGRRRTLPAPLPSPASLANQADGAVAEAADRLAIGPPRVDVSAPPAAARRNGSLTRPRSSGCARLGRAASARCFSCSTPGRRRIRSRRTSLLSRRCPSSRWRRPRGRFLFMRFGFECYFCVMFFFLLLRLIK